MSSKEPPVLRLLIGGFAIGALGHVQGPVAMATELIAGGPEAAGQEQRPAPPAEAAVPEVMAQAEMMPAAIDEAEMEVEVANASLTDFGSDESISHLRMLVTAMPPDQAAAILEAIPVEDAAQVVTGLPVTSAVAMLAAMSPQGSADLTEALTTLPDSE